MVNDLEATIAAWPGRGAVGIAGREGVVATAGAPDSVFAWASVTKLLTALAVLVAVEETIVGLDQPVGPPGSTLAHLLAHASGLDAKTGALRCPPGTRRIYSNRGFELAAAAVAEAAGMPFDVYLSEAVLEPAGLHHVRLAGSPAHGAEGPLTDLLALGRELLAPRCVSAATLARATTVAWPGLAGVLPGFGHQDPCDWGLGFELRDAKSPHWTGQRNSPQTFGHFGRSGSFLWVDPVAGLACGGLRDVDFGSWAVEAWPALSDAVLSAYGPRR